MNWMPKSIRWRIQIWHGLVLLCVLAGFGVTAIKLQTMDILSREDSQLNKALGMLNGRPHLTFPPSRGEPGGRGLPPADGVDAFVLRFLGEPAREEAPHPPPGPGWGAPQDHPMEALRPAKPHSADLAGLDGYYFASWSRDGTMTGHSQNAPAGIQCPIAEGGSALSVSWRNQGPNREAFLFTPPGECLLVGKSLAPEMQALARMAWWYAGTGGVVLAAGLTVGWWLAGRAIRPVERISSAAARIAEGSLSERIDIDGADDELGSLARVLNNTFAKLDASFTRQARFTADAAHELRTPLSILLSQTQLALARERDAAEYKQTIASCQRAAKRMHSLIESLLELSKLDSNAQPDLQPCDLADIGRENIALIRPLADERQITLKGDLQPAPCSVDAKRVTQILTNLLSNAVKFSQPGDEVTLATHRLNGTAFITVTDTGPGIDADHLPHLFDRFYRADDSRSRATGGAGLGLAICKSIAEAHGGSISVQSTQGQGSTFTLSLPAEGNLSPAI